MGAKNSIADQLEEARRVLDGARDGGPELAARLAQVGYDTAALSAGRTLYEASGGAVTAAFSERGDQFGATTTVTALRKKVEGQYKTLEQIATTVFKDKPDATKSLGLGDGQKARPRKAATTADGAAIEPPASRLSNAQAAFFVRARILYGNALKDQDIAAELAKVGYSQTRLEAEFGDLTALEVADTKQESEKAEAKGSTAAQKAALTQLNDWISRFSGIVVPALKDRPELLEKMGLKVRGGKR
jgi:hypothetical protein